jgi:acyl transferase domain-containing protein
MLKNISLPPPSIPYVLNLMANWIAADQAASPAYHATRLRQPVRFETGFRTQAADSALLLLKAGAGGTLSSLARATADIPALRDILLAPTMCCFDEQIAGASRDPAVVAPGVDDREEILV